MAKLGFLGLGIMGYPMARNLLSAGHHVALWSHTASKAEELAAKFPDLGTACAAPKDVAASADVIFLIVGDTAMSEHAIFGPDGIMETAKPGTVIVDASTVACAYSKSASVRCAAKGVDFLDAPCTGSKPGAADHKGEVAAFGAGFGAGARSVEEIDSFGGATGRGRF